MKISEAVRLPGIFNLHSSISTLYKKDCRFRGSPFCISGDWQNSVVFWGKAYFAEAFLPALEMVLTPSMARITARTTSRTPTIAWT